MITYLEGGFGGGGEAGLPPPRSVYVLGEGAGELPDGLSLIGILLSPVLTKIITKYDTF